MKRTRQLTAILLLLLGALAPGRALSQASPTFSGVYSFLSSTDGSAPTATLVQGNDGNLYGTTLSGGRFGAGTFFELTASGTHTVLASFGGLAGSEPSGNLVLGSDGNFYGTTRGGGLDFGTIYQITPAGSLTTLHAFSQDDGWQPIGGLAQGADGSLYGTTYYGGAQGCGTIFKITKAGAFTPLYSFPGGKGGSNPAGGLVQAADGNFYGSTEFGGTISIGVPGGYGTLFQFNPATGTVTQLYAFIGGADGDGPWSSMIIGTDGCLYGTSYGALGNQFGAAFKMTTGGSFFILHSFTNGNDGAYPFGNLILGSDGNYYGTASSGGVLAPGVPGYGTLFEVSSSGNYNVLHTFAGTDGSTPWGGLIQSANGLLYGTTSQGNSGFGGVFSESIGAAAIPTFAAGLTFFSSPYDYTGVSLATLFGYGGPSLAVFSSATNSWDVTPNVPADAIRLGVGYWCRFPQAVTFSRFGAQASTGNPFTIILNMGWNMIGDPFSWPVPVTNLTFGAGNMTFLQATATPNPLINPTLWGYTSGTYYPAGSLKPLSGYWIYAYAATTMNVPAN